jgi:hypothetical protein
VYDPRVTLAARSGLTIAIALAMVAPSVAAPGGAAGPVADPAPAAAVTIALLPLATGKGLALYGQPVASELARALRAGGLDVVVVSAGAPVPARARLVIDGTVAPDGDGVALEVRVRDPARGAVVATLAARAPELAAIDRAAADLSVRLLPAIRAQLAQASPVAHAPVEHTPVDHAPVDRAPVDHAPVDHAPVAPAPAALIVARSLVLDFPAAAAASIATALVRRVHHRAVPGELAPGPLVGADFAVVVEITAFDVEQVGVLIGRARARVRWIGATGAVIAERVVHTDTVVGNRRGDAAALARACADQLVAIVAPRVAAWAARSQ